VKFLPLLAAFLPLTAWLIAVTQLIIAHRSLRVLREIPPVTGPFFPKISIIIPARNEARKLEFALQSILRLDYPQLEIIVVNDRSTDETGQILDRIAQADGRLTVQHISTLPPGWLGKNYALHLAAQSAVGEFLLFTDADVAMDPLTLKKALRCMQDGPLDHLTILPEGTMPGRFLQLLGVTFGFFLLVWFQPWKARNPRSRSHLGVGAFNFVRTTAYRMIGGHQPIALRPDDDLKLGKLLKLNGYKQDVLIGHDMVTVEWYQSIPEFIDGLMKNAFAGVEYRLSLVILGTLTAFLIHIWPWVGVWVTMGIPQVLLGLTLGLMLGTVFLVLKWNRMAGWTSLLFPFAVLMLVFIQWRATVLTLWRGGITWRGTFYPLPELKANKV